MKKQYKLVDILKFIFAIGVVAIHSQILNQSNNFSWFILHGICRLAVPFFFCCSGFFIGIKLCTKNNVTDKIVEIKKYIKRLFIPFLFWMIIGLPFEIYNLRNKSLIIIGLKLIQKIVFYPWGALWYILAVIVSLVILIPFIKKDK